MRHAASILLPLLLRAGCGDEQEASLPKPGPGQIAKGEIRKLIHFVAVKGFDHFSILAPANDLIAAKILHDEGPTTSIAFSEEEMNELGQR